MFYHPKLQDYERPRDQGSVYHCFIFNTKYAFRTIKKRKNSLYITIFFNMLIKIAYTTVIT